MKKLLMLMTLATLLFSCEKDKDKEVVFKGAKVQFHDGKAWSWIKMAGKGVPAELGVSISNAAMNSMPTETGEGHHNHENNIVLPLHREVANSTPFQSIAVEWAPAGHPPAGVYTLPHFDFHFYLMTAEEVAAAVDPAKLVNNPAQEYIPQHYIPIDPVPQMGRHWIDVTSPELNPNNPQTFTQTFIYGSYDGKVNFYEPMMTLAFLKNTNTFSRSIPQPAKVSKTGYYPRQMKINKTAEATEVILYDFVMRTAT